MDVRVNQAELQAALQSLKPYYGSDNVWPFASFAVREGALWVYGTDRAAFTCYGIQAAVAEDSECLGVMGETLNSLVKTAQGDVVHLHSTDQNLIIEDEFKFKARLARSSDMPTLIEQFEKARQEIQVELSAIFSTEALHRLLRLSTAFPAHTATDRRWCVIAFDSADCSGSIQETEAGGVESLLLESQEHSGQGNISFLSARLQALLSLAGDHVLIQSGVSRKSRVLISDPDNPAWWMLAAQFLRPGETLE